MPECVTDIYRKIASLALGKPEGSITELECGRARTAVGQTIYADDPDVDFLLGHFHNVPQGNIEEIRDLLYCILRKDLTLVGPQFQHGTYQHFKGGRHVTLVRAKAAGTGTWSIVHMSLLDGVVYVRDEADFSAVIRWADGKYRSRFIRAVVTP